MSWVSKELASVSLGDERLALRLMRVVEALAARPACSLPQAFDSEAEVRAAYRLFENDRVEWRRILAPHSERTAQRAQAEEVVLVAQDTTEINLSSHRATTGLGYLGSSKCRGVLAHSGLALTTAGTPLGVVDLRLWTRATASLGKGKKRRQKDTADKESQRWIEGLHASERAFPTHRRVVLMGDRESDIYDLFAEPRQANHELLVRVCRENRCVEHPQRYLKPALQTAPVQGHLQVDVPKKRGQSPRRARLSVRWMTLALRPSQYGPKKPRQSVTLTFILLEEIDPPAGEKAVRWVLATTMTVSTLEDALQLVSWYTRRWQIERYHFTLKSGCQVEKRQFEAVDNVERALAVFAIVAWRVLWITHEAREHPDVPCTIVLGTTEWQALYRYVHRQVPLPTQPPTLQQAVRMLGRLGGHLGRKGDGEPGVKTIWRGLRRLADITAGYLLAQTNSKPTSQTHPLPRDSIATCGE